MWLAVELEVPELERELLRLAVADELGVLEELGVVGPLFVLELVPLVD